MERAVSATEESRDELFARSCVERIEGVDLSRRDFPGRDGSVDYHVLYPDGPAALEVTTLTDEDFRHFMSVMPEVLGFTPQRYSWRVAPNIGCKVKDARRHVPQLIEMCEAEGVLNPADLSDQDHPAVIWLEAGHVELVARESPGAPRIDVMPPAIGGAVKDALSALVEAVGSLLETPLLQRKIHKLNESELSERHLFLLIDSQGLDFGPYYGIGMSEDVPGVAPDVPGSLTHLWLATGFRLGGVLRWSRKDGWSRHWPFDGL